MPTTTKDQIQTPKVESPLLILLGNVIEKINSPDPNATAIWNCYLSNCLRVIIVG